METTDYRCTTCWKPLESIPFRDGTVWDAATIARLSLRKHGRVLCLDHYREANEKRRRTALRDTNMAF